MLTNKRDIKSPVGTKLSCKSWAAKRRIVCFTTTLIVMWLRTLMR